MKWDGITCVGVLLSLHKLFLPSDYRFFIPDVLFIYLFTLCSPPLLYNSSPIYLCLSLPLNLHPFLIPNCLPSLHLPIPTSFLPTVTFTFICFLPAEWRHGRAGRVTLSDEDSTVVTGAGGWRAINTLAHYGVRDSAVMALIPRQNDSFSSNCKW